MFKRGDRIEPTEESDNLCPGTVQEDQEALEWFSGRPNAVYVLLDGEFYPRYLDALLFRLAHE